jgi:predicted 3-demethylubiquinone-9 3-methyltransferase (glyoxalase superfamily)
MGLNRTAKIYPHRWYTREVEEAAQRYVSIVSDSRIDRVSTLLLVSAHEGGR